MVDDYKDEDVFETKVKYKTVMQDQYKEHHETVRKYQVDVAELQAGLVSQLDRTLDDGIREAVEYADKQTEEMKVQFTAMFDELDKLIQENMRNWNRWPRMSRTVRTCWNRAAVF